MKRETMLPEVTDEVILRKARESLEMARAVRLGKSKSTRKCRLCGERRKITIMRFKRFGKYRNRQWVCEECNKTLPPKVVDIFSYAKK